MSSASRLAAALAFAAWAIPAGAEPLPLVNRGLAGAVRDESEEARDILGEDPGSVAAWRRRTPGAPAGSAALEKRFARLPGVTPSLQGEFRGLTPDDRSAAVEILEVAHAVLRRAPPGRELVLLRELGVGGLALIRDGGEPALEAVLWLSGDEVGTPGLVGLWRSAARSGGFDEFWSRWVEPNRGAWADGDALSAYLATPGRFHGGDGGPTAEGRALLSGIGIDAPEGTASPRRGRWETPAVVVLPVASLIFLRLGLRRPRGRKAANRSPFWA